jgi:hypothetical protein
MQGAKTLIFDAQRQLATANSSHFPNPRAVTNQIRAVRAVTNQIRAVRAVTNQIRAVRAVTNQVPVILEIEKPAIGKLLSHQASLSRQPKRMWQLRQ